MYSRVYMKLLYYLTIYMYNRVRLERLAVVVSVLVSYKRELYSIYGLVRIVLRRELAVASPCPLAEAVSRSWL